MKPSKRLSLNRAVVSDLSTDELSRIPGGAFAPPTAINCPTIHRRCPSNPLTDCTVIHVTEDTCIC